MSSQIRQEFKGTDRFTIHNRLGSGSFGIVYQAFDRERNSTVALKTLSLNNASALYRFKKEFRSLADILHPNLVTLYELIADGEQWFFTMELVEGRDFISYLRGTSRDSQLAEILEGSTIRSEDGQIANVFADATVDSQSMANISSPLTSPTLLPDFDQLRIVLKQLVEGVCALHKAGKLHRDIKSSNVMVTKDGRVVLLDFGLVTEIIPDGSGSGDLIGTPNYMSPEQIVGVNISEASDWYGVGVMLYEALTGQLPFSGKFFEVLNSKRSFDPPTPSKLISGIPPDLDQLCTDLLKREPQARPSGAEILKRLGGVSTKNDEQRQPQPKSLALTGRANHLTSLSTAFQAMQDGETVAVCLHGRSGMGKSVLVRHFLEDLQQKEPALVILAGRCYHQESVPYKAMDSLIDSLSRYLKSLPAPEAEALMPHDVQALARLFPVLKQVEAVTGAQRRVLEIPDSQELRRRAFAALRELLIRLSDRKPLLLFIDDLQWGDIDSAALLAEILRSPDPPALILIACYRSEETQSSPMLQSLLSFLANSDSRLKLLELNVAELDEMEARSLALKLLGEVNSASFARAEMIARESGGNPFFIDELVRYWQAGDSPSESPDQKKSEFTLNEVVQGRVARLPDEARRLLEIVAVAGQPIDFDIVRKAAEISSEEPTILAALRAGHLLRTRGLRHKYEIEIYHDRISEIITANLSTERLKALHLKLAQALESSDQIDPEKLVIHYQKAENFNKAAQYVLLAAAQASETLAFDHAAQLYQLALNLQDYRTRRPEEQDSVRQLQLKLGEALANAGRGRESAQAYLAAVDGARAAEKLELRRRAAEQLLRCGHIDEGLAVIHSLLDTFGVKLAKTPQRALLSLLWHRAQIYWRGMKFQERDESQIAPEELIRIDILWTVSGSLGMVDPIRGADFQARHLLLALKTGEPLRIAKALAVEGAYSCFEGNRNKHRTEKLLQKAMAMAEKINNPTAQARAFLFTGLGAFLQGNFKRSQQLCESAEQTLRERCTGVIHELSLAQLFYLRALICLGELETLSQRVTKLVIEAQERGDLYAETNLRTRITYLAFLAVDDPERAQQEVDEAIRKWSQQGFHAQHYFALIADCEIALYRGEAEKAIQIVKDRWPALTKSLLMRVQLLKIEMLHLRARCYLAGAVNSTNPQPLLQTAERDAATIMKEKSNYGLALGHLILAGAASIRGNREQAIKDLSLAEKNFEDCFMSLYAASTRFFHGRLLSGTSGNLLQQNALNWIDAQKIKNPARIIEMHAPGKY